ncbi:MULTISPECIES: BrnT family toxin [unclassified Phenylobacterium]|uniref:BrnT family toxin n=1 Tax=unclassified Phenylobacterium TaxID=2640670 RepID=UPI0009E968B9|nr:MULTISPECIES: BrnT family toxin [unclassified Phenylobacterium]
METSYDEKKRKLTLENRGLDFADAGKIFAGLTLTVEDDRTDYGEVRYQTIGRLVRSTLMVVWTPRGKARHIISMRKCNDREKERYRASLGGL